MLQPAPFQQPNSPFHNLNVPKHCCLHPGLASGEACREKRSSMCFQLTRCLVLPEGPHSLSPHRYLGAPAGSWADPLMPVQSEEHCFIPKKATTAQMSPRHSLQHGPTRMQVSTAEAAKGCPRGRDFLQPCQPFRSRDPVKWVLHRSIKPWLRTSFPFCTVLFHFTCITRCWNYFPFIILCPLSTWQICSKLSGIGQLVGCFFGLYKYTITAFWFNIRDILFFHVTTQLCRQFLHLSFVLQQSNPELC